MTANKPLVYAEFYFQPIRVVIFNKLVSRVQNFLVRAVIFGKHNFFGLRKVVLKPQDIGNRSSAESVDTLVVVAHRRELGLSRGDKADKIILRPVYILKLVHQNKLITLLQAFLKY